MVHKRMKGGGRLTLMGIPERRLAEVIRSPTPEGGGGGGGSFGTEGRETRVWGKIKV